MPPPSASTLDRASVKAKERAAVKASRAAAAGIALPTRKKRNGWQILREKLKNGTLVTSIKQAGGAWRPQSASKRRRSTTYALKQHMADIAVQVAQLDSDFSKADPKLVSEYNKVAQELQKRKRQERQIRRKLIKKQKKLERELEYLNFPTILGWYFDGFFTPFFQLNEEYATIFNQMEVDISKEKENSIKETFVEKAKRYFWPPRLIGHFCFRTRGIYLDFKEIIQDPPHTPPELILDQRVEAVTLFVANEAIEESKVPSEEEGHHAQPSVAELAAEEDHLQALLKAVDDNPDLTPEQKAAKKKALLFAFKKRKHKSLLQMQVAKEMHFKAINRNDFYFDDQRPGFFKKNPYEREKYYYDTKWDVWRIKRTIIYFPHDFYWDEQLALFFPKDRTRPQDYYLYDPKLGAYRIAGQPVPPNWRGIKPTDFFFDHKYGRWVKKTKAPAGVSPYLDNNGERFCINKDNDTPDDFYFDFETQKFEKKTDGKYTYDSLLWAWKKTGSGGPNKGSLKPLDFYWNENEHAFTKKDAPSSFFAWDGNSKFFRKKKSLHGKFHPKNWTWVDKKKTWELKKFASRHNLISDSLYWRPDRDYDKPWLEYVGGYRDYHIEYDYERLSDDDPGVKLVGPGGKVLGKTDGDGSSKAGTKKIQFSTSEPTLKVTGSTAAPGSKGKEDNKGKTTEESGTVGPGGKPTGIMKGSPPQSQENFDYIDTIDRKTLKITNLGSVINDTDIRKYFASVKKIVRPKVPGTDFEEDYAYLKFKTNEAAAAALKTMNDQQIRGREIQLSYKLKAEDETVGGNRQESKIPKIL